jgi:hypothetical protein
MNSFSGPTRNRRPKHCTYLATSQPNPTRLEAERGEAHCRKALSLAEPRGMRSLVAHCHLGLGRLYGRTDKHDEARKHLAIGTTLYREMEMGFWVEQADAELHQLGSR